MPLDFPNTPSFGQTYSASGITWTWDGTKWTSVSNMSSADIKDTPPSQPFPGQLWFDSASPQLYVWYSDPNSSQWVIATANAGGLSADAPVDGNVYGRKNGAWMGVLPLSGGQITNSLLIGQSTWTPASTPLTPILDCRSNLAGVVSGASTMQRFLVSNDTMDARLGDNSCFSDLGIYHNVGGAGVNGGRQTIWSQLTVGALTPPGLQMNGINSTIFVNGNTNGAFCQPLSTDVRVLAGNSVGSGGVEFLLSVEAGSTINDKYFLQLTYGGGDRVAGTGEDDGLRFASANGFGAPGAGMLIALGNNSQGWPVSATGTVLGAHVQIGNQGVTRNLHFIPPQCAYGIDFANANFTGAAFRSAGFSVDGAGQIQFANATLGTNASGVTLDVPRQIVTAATVAAGGGGGGSGTNDYYVGDILFTATGGQYRVATVTAGAVATVAILAPGSAASPPANPVATTGGSGIGCTLTLTWAARNTVSISPGGGPIQLGAPTTLNSPDATTSDQTLMDLQRTGASMLQFQSAGNRTQAQIVAGAGYAMSVLAHGSVSFFIDGSPVAQVSNGFGLGSGFVMLGSRATSGATVFANGAGVQVLHLQGNNNGGVSIDDRVGFNSVAPIAKPTVSGAKGSNAALASLLTALAAYGLITDSTSA